MDAEESLRLITLEKDVNSMSEVLDKEGESAEGAMVLEVKQLSRCLSRNLIAMMSA